MSLPCVPRVSLAALFVLASLASTPGHAGAADRPVALGEISSVVVRRDVDLRALLRSTSEQELGALDLSRVPAKKRSILSVSLVRMDSTVVGAGSKSTTCVVSATLRDARRGAIFAILEGKARATGDPSSSPSVERSVLEAAVRGAMARIPEALKR